MNRWFTLGLIAVFGLALTAGAAFNADTGKVVYQKKCATCHGPMGEGNPGMAKMLKVELKHLGSKEVQAKTDAEWKKIIAEGQGKMKAVKLTDEETANVIAFVRTLDKK
jgi:mono/diheme cytochrome c family protein